MKEVFSKKKYIDSTIKKFIDTIEHWGPEAMQERLHKIIKSYTSWVDECDGLTIDECEKLGYAVNVYDWLDLIE